MSLHPSPSSIKSSFKRLSSDFDHLNHSRLLSKGFCSAGNDPRNRDKNRYCDLFALDGSRVILPTTQMNDNIDNTHFGYINASHVSLRELPDRRFILAQGPMHPDYHGEDTTGDFW